MSQVSSQPDPGISTGPERFSVILLGLPPVYRHGLLAGLAAAGMDCVPVTSTEELARASGRPAPVVVLPADLVPDLQALHAAGTPPAVAVHVVKEADARAYAEALRAGATGVVGLDDDLRRVVAVVRAAVDGHTLLPRGIARALCRPANGPPPSLSSAEREWLLRLADSTTVSGLARRVGYSEREMYRLLAGVYARLGAGNRTEALLNADRWGLLDREAE